MSIKRRDFLKYIGGLTASAPWFSAFSLFDVQSVKKPLPNTSHRVVINRNPEIFSASGSISPAILDRMLSDCIRRLTGHQTSKAAWLSLFAPADRIGIKVNSLGGRNISTHHELAYAVAHQLTACGIPARNIIIWDRLTRELSKAGYTITKQGSFVRCFGTDNDYEFRPEISGSIGSCFSKILTRKCNAIISIPVLKDHDLAGVSLNLKNFYGAIHNPNKYHDNGCDPFIADLNTHAHIKNKMRLVIIDALTAQCHGGPAFRPQWSWPYGGIIASRDPVAADLVGTRILEKQRRFKGLPTLQKEGRYPKHIHTAAQQGLGIADIDKIEKIFI